MNILITGASGFVGRAVLDGLYSSDAKLIAPVRSGSADFAPRVQTPIVNDISDLPEVLTSIENLDVVVHLAAKAHVAGVALAEFKQINTLATLNLAKTAAANGVRRFIFLSSIGVHGITSNKPFRADDRPAPVEDYAVSKLEAEIGLQQIAAETGMDVVIIRPPLVYGAGAPGNFGKLLRLTKKNWPLPFGAIYNKRSLVAVDNLVDLIITCIDHPCAANQTFLVSDDQDLSTTELLRLMIKACGENPKLLPLPLGLLKLISKLTGKAAVIERLCGNLQVDISHTKQTLSWQPPVTVEQGIARCFKKEDLC